jgi:hypothetical protein
MNFTANADSPLTGEAINIEITGIPSTLLVMKARDMLFAPYETGLSFIP